MGSRRGRLAGRAADGAGGVSAAREVRSLRAFRRLERLGLPRLALSLHTTQPRVAARREALLDQLIDQGQLDVVRALAAGTLSIVTVEAHAREHGLGGAGLSAQLVLAEPLWEALKGTLPAMGRADATRLRYAVTVAQLRQRLPKTEGLTVRDLLRVDWERLRAAWPGSAADWMHVRRLLSRFLSLRLGSKLHPVRAEVLARIPTAPEVERVPELTPDVFHAVVDAARADLRPALWTLVLTGMRVGEYLRCTRADLRPALHAVAVPGTKTTGAAALVRVAPELWGWIDQGIPAPLRYKALRLAWKAALRAAGADEGLRLHDLRHAHGQWAVEAGVPEALVQVSLRHAQASTTRRYTKQHGRAAVAAGLAKHLTTARTQGEA